MFNLLDSYNPISVKQVVRYLHRTPHKGVLVEDDGLYASYTISMTSKTSGVTELVEILLDYSYPNFGGLRYWLVCAHCHKRVVNLYQYRRTLACRHCLGLKYGSKLYTNQPMLMAYVRRKKALELLATRRLIYANKLTRAGRRLNRYLRPGEFEGIMQDMISLNR